MGGSGGFRDANLEPIFYFLGGQTLNLKPIIFCPGSSNIKLRTYHFFLNGQTLDLRPFAAEICEPRYFEA
jgi:hypothetical protein